MIKAVLFDVDGVLLDSLEANFVFFQSLFAKAGYPHFTKEDMSFLFHLSMWDVIKVWTKESNAEVNRLWEMGQRRKEIPYPSHLLTMPEAAGEIIKRLHDAYQLGIVTSRIREGIYKMPVLAPLEKYFTVTIAYEDTTHHKPNPEPLLLACKRLQLNPSEVVYVGDAETDILAARAAKMKVILYAQENFIDADAYAATFQELPECISFLN